MFVSNPREAVSLQKLNTGNPSGIDQLLIQSSSLGPLTGCQLQIGDAKSFRQPGKLKHVSGLGFRAIRAKSPETHCIGNDRLRIPWLRLP